MTLNHFQIIVHDYEGIKLNLIWDIVTEDIIQLKADLEKILEDL